jgi:hypothetical protein
MDGSQKKEFFFVIYVFLVVEYFPVFSRFAVKIPFPEFGVVFKSFAFRRLRRNEAGYKKTLNNLQIIVAWMNNYAIMSSDEWLIEAMMKNGNIEKL